MAPGSAPAYISALFLRICVPVSLITVAKSIKPPSVFAAPLPKPFTGSLIIGTSHIPGKPKGPLILFSSQEVAVDFFSSFGSSRVFQ